jgi:AcrR family transcriptional regulator
LPTRAEQKENRRQAILEAELDLFIRKGYAATKILVIADRSGMSAGLLFHYFESKEKLYEELVRIGASGPRSSMPLPGEAPTDYFERTAKNIFAAIKNQPAVAKMFVLMNQAMHGEAVSLEVRELLSQTDLVASSVPLIEAGQTDKTIREGDPHALAVAYWSAVTGVAENIALRPGCPCPEAEWIMDILKNK